MRFSFLLIILAATLDDPVKLLLKVLFLYQFQIGVKCVKYPGSASYLIIVGQVVGHLKLSAATWRVSI